VGTPPCDTISLMAGALTPPAPPPTDPPPAAAPAQGEGADAGEMSVANSVAPSPEPSLPAAEALKAEGNALFVASDWTGALVS